MTIGHRKVGARASALVAALMTIALLAGVVGVPEGQAASDGARRLDVGRAKLRCVAGDGRIEFTAAVRAREQRRKRGAESARRVRVAASIFPGAGTDARKRRLARSAAARRVSGGAGWVRLRLALDRAKSRRVLRAGLGAARCSGGGDASPLRVRLAAVAAGRDDATAAGRPRARARARRVSDVWIEVRGPRGDEPRACQGRPAGGVEASLGGADGKGVAVAEPCRVDPADAADEPAPAEAPPPPNTPGTDPQRQAARFASAETVGTVRSAEITEASGLAVSRGNPGVLWTHNDSGGGAELFAVATDGALAAKYVLNGAGSVDWEDIAIGPGPASGRDYVYVGDIGDNRAARSSVTVYRIEEPPVEPADGTTRSIGAGDVERLELRYPDGARDAETLMVEPHSGDLLLVSKRDAQGRVYRATSSAWSTGTATLERVATLGWTGAVGGDISRDGTEAVVKGYGTVTHYAADPAAADPAAALVDALGGSGTALPYSAEPQGEAVGFDDRGNYFTVSEGLFQPIRMYRRLE